VHQNNWFGMQRRESPWTELFKEFVVRHPLNVAWVIIFWNPLPILRCSSGEPRKGKQRERKKIESFPLPRHFLKRSGETWQAWFNSLPDRIPGDMISLGFSFPGYRRRDETRVTTRAAYSSWSNQFLGRTTSNVECRFLSLPALSRVSRLDRELGFLSTLRLWNMLLSFLCRRL
jgi:hypothetical protein